jgi:hypothetical protein
MIKKIIKILISIIFLANCNLVFASNVGLPTRGIDLFNPNEEISYTNTESTASGFFGSKISNVVGIILGFASLVVFGLVLYGGIVILTSNGKKDSYKTGLNVIKTTFIGILIIIFSYVIVDFIVKNITRNIARMNVGTDNTCDISKCSVGQKCSSGKCVNITTQTICYSQGDCQGYKEVKYYCYLEGFFGLPEANRNKCIEIVGGEQCACPTEGASASTCKGICTNCTSQNKCGTSVSDSYNGFCTPNNTNGYWYCQAK